MSFNFAEGWNNNQSVKGNLYPNNKLSFRTGKETENVSEHFTKSLITTLLLSAKKAKAGSEGAALKEALATGSDAITILSGVRQASYPHIVLQFEGDPRPWHVNVSRQGSNWKVSEIPARASLLVETDEDYDRVMSQVRQVRARYDESLKSFDDLVGIGIGYAEKSGVKTQEMSLILDVLEKKAAAKLAGEEIIPSFISLADESDGSAIIVRLDVQIAGHPELELDCEKCNEDLKERKRPVQGGYSVGNVNITAGTLGGWFFDKVGKRIVLLSNDHVLVNGTERKIVQPGTYDGGKLPGDLIGELVRSAGPELDAAIASVDKDSYVKAGIACIKPTAFTIGEPKVSMKITKVGRTTGRTCGIIKKVDYSSSILTGNNHDIYVDGDGADFSQGGDSGSLYLRYDDNSVIVGLHKAGDTGIPDNGIGTNINPIMANLQLDVLAGGLPDLLVELAMSGGNTTTLALPEQIRYPHSPEFVSLFDGIYDEMQVILEAGSTPNSLYLVLGQKAELLQNTLLDRDGWRTSLLTLMSLIGGTVSSHEALGRKISDSDVSNLIRLIKVAQAINPEEGEFLKRLQDVVANSAGLSLEELLLSALSNAKTATLAATTASIA
ncbi:MAG: hypothetical protein AB8H47_10865 [Bacteroidia bacterium]